MSTITTIVPMCDRCGELPGKYVDTTAPAHMRDTPYCERCVQNQGMERRGERFAAVEILGHVIATLKNTGLTDAQIIAAAADVLAKPDEVGLSPAPGEHIVCPMRDYFSEGDRPWLDGFALIGETS